MIETEARVVAVEPGLARVTPRLHSPCGQCDPVHGCRSVSLARLFSQGSLEYIVRDPIGTQPGDSVIVASREGSFLHSVACLYVAPLAGLLAGAALGLPWGEAVSVSAALGGAFLALVGVRWHAQHLKAGAELAPFIERRIPSSTVRMEKTCRSRK